jgi:hypothetical protein
MLRDADLRARPLEVRKAMLALLAAPARFQTAIKRRIPSGVARTRMSLVPHGRQIGPICADFLRAQRRISDIEDCLTERGEFELPVPISEQPDDNRCRGPAPDEVSDRPRAQTPGWLVPSATFEGDLPP